MKTISTDLESEELKEISRLTGQLAENIEKKEKEVSNKNFAQILVENGYGEETLITDKEGFNRVTTLKRMEILEKLNREEIGSVKQLADELERDGGNLSRDLEILFQEDMIEYQHDGKKKKPVLKHTKIVIEPLEIE